MRCSLIIPLLAVTTVTAASSVPNRGGVSPAAAAAASTQLAFLETVANYTSLLDVPSNSLVNHTVPFTGLTDSIFING